ncbi:VTT domain-containing protein [Marinomonas sp. 15G1-11]|uniref:VTT domain-containing protein n=1 Tax=Marinomonas phaeophyticola TaxID=3004091 RepID=A0ABT4JUC6_9GAMM|nr:VTT domain-containing protein [Marinomonas sp. 15G1-11]MCZ2721184.1 VTT domain-containing protein [Marinomonas sp. 15G1-11]
MLDTLLTWSQNPYAIALGIIFISYILEDAAIVGAALLSVEGSLPTHLGIMAVFIGIASGDIGLFYIGRYCHKFHWVQQRLSHSKVIKIQHKLQQNAFLNVFLIRFLPGLRGTGYLVCGALHIKPATFFLSVGLATFLWSILIYASVFALGDALWVESSLWRWGLAPMMIIVIISINKLINTYLLKEQPA